MTNEKRPYQKKARAEQEAQTRLLITEAAIALHGTVGPAFTSVSGIAERAGLPRSTIYRHFADEAMLFDACSAHWMQQNPRPELGEWAAIENPDERLQTALGELYGYYSRTHDMLANLLRDENTVPVVKQRFAAFHDYFDAAREILTVDRPADEGHADLLRAAVGHAIALSTWQSLTRDQGLGDRAATELMCTFVAGAARGLSPSD